MNFQQLPERALPSVLFVEPIPHECKYQDIVSFQMLSLIRPIDVL